jgi:CYTH domain-containing protein
VTIERTPGRGRYAATEREQRWLLHRLPDGVVDRAEIFDTYLEDSTLRLRRVQAGSTVVYKFGQKVRHDAGRPSLVQMTNMYLTEPEFELLRQLGGAELHKTRWRWTVDGSELSVDVFGGPLAGLVLAETELAIDADGLSRPPHAVAEVTRDERFSGGHLARTTPSDAVELMQLVARMTNPDRQA